MLAQLAWMLCGWFWMQMAETYIVLLLEPIRLYCLDYWDQYTQIGMDYSDFLYAQELEIELEEEREEEEEAQY